MLFACPYGAGIVEPIKAGSRDPKLGLGKQEQDDFYTCEENVHRKKLEVELEDTEEKARKREVCYELQSGLYLCPGSNYVMGLSVVPKFWEVR